MTLPTGTISMSQVNVELQLSATTPISLNQASVRLLADVPSGTISMNNLRGKTYRYLFTPTISANTANYNLKAAAIAAGWNQVLPLGATVTINAGVSVYATTTGGYAFDTGATFPLNSTLALVNNGTIQGMGGAGGNGWVNGGVSDYLGFPGSAGGPALRAQYAISITNNGTIGGGGGGGGGGSGNVY